MTVRMTLIGGCAALALAACGAEPEPTGTEAVDAAAEAAAAQAQPSPLAAAPTPEAPAAPPVAAIQTNAGPDGTQVSLTRARVTGNVLTVELSYRPPGNATEHVYLDVEEVSVIDDTTSQRYGVLRDGSNQWMAAPLQSTGGDRLHTPLRDGRPAIVWFKFPAPPATSPTVSINVPNVGPFDGVTVQR